MWTSTSVRRSSFASSLRPAPSPARAAEACATSIELDSAGTMALPLAVSDSRVVVTRGLTTMEVSRVTAGGGRDARAPGIAGTDR